MDDTAFARRLSLVLVIAGTLAAGLWTLLAQFIANWNEDSDCVREDCDDAAQFIGLGRPVWIAYLLIVGAFLFALRRQPRPCWLLLLSSLAPLVLIHIPHTGYALNQILAFVWLTIGVLAGIVVGFAPARRAPG